MEIKYAYFSAAIRDGARFRPMAHGFLMTNDGRSCALGAGAEAAGVSIPMGEESQLGVYSAVENLFPYLKRNRARCPECDFGEGYHAETLTNMIWHLNDHHSWERERVADWLYAEEEKLGFVTVSDEGFGSTQPVAFVAALSEAEESLCQAQV